MTTNRHGKYARRVKQALAADPEVVSHGYQWCLQKVKDHWDQTWEATHTGEGSRAQRIRTELLRRITPEALQLADDD